MESAADCCCNLHVSEQSRIDETIEILDDIFKRSPTELEIGTEKVCNTCLEALYARMMIITENSKVLHTQEMREEMSDRTGWGSDFEFVQS